MQEPDPPTMRNGILDTPVWASMRYNEYSHKHQKACANDNFLISIAVYPTTTSVEDQPSLLLLSKLVRKSTCYDRS